MTALLPCLTLAVLTQTARADAAAAPARSPAASDPDPEAGRAPAPQPDGPAPTQTATPPCHAAPVQAAPRRRARRSMPPAGDGTPRPTTPSCDEVRQKARFNVYFDKVDIEKLVQTVVRRHLQDLHPRRQRPGEDLHHRPGQREGGRQRGRVLRRLPRRARRQPAGGRALRQVSPRSWRRPRPSRTTFRWWPRRARYTTNEQMMTRMFKVRYVDLEPLRGVVQQLVSQNGDTIPFQPDTLIVNDLGSNMHRLERIIEQLDSRSSSDEMRVIQIRYATATTWRPPSRSCSTPRRTGPAPGRSDGDAPRPASPRSSTRRAGERRRAERQSGVGASAGPATSPPSSPTSAPTS